MQPWERGEVMCVTLPGACGPALHRKFSRVNALVCVCVLPAWSKGWVQTLVGMADKKVYFEGGSRMFEVGDRPASNTRWGIWAIKIRAGPRPTFSKDAVYPKTIFIPRWRPIKAMGVNPTQPTQAMG